MGKYTISSIQSYSLIRPFFLLTSSVISGEWVMQQVPTDPEMMMKIYFLFYLFPLIVFFKR